MDAYAQRRRRRCREDPATLPAERRLPSAKHDNYPIPTIQIELSKVDGETRVPQNTGW